MSIETLVVLCITSGVLTYGYVVARVAKRRVCAALMERARTQPGARKVLYLLGEVD